MESKIGCVNHDCEKCKAQQYQAAHCKLGPNFCKECAVEQKKTVAAIMYHDHLEKPWVHVIQDDLPSGTKLFAKPAQRTWVGLSDEEIEKWTPEIHSVIRAIEELLKEKNNG